MTLTLQDRKGNMALVLLLGLTALFFIFVIYTTFTGPFETIRDSFNDTYTTTDQLSTSQNIDNAWHWAFVILAFTVFVWVFLSALKRQPREYYL